MKTNQKFYFLSVVQVTLGIYLSGCSLFNSSTPPSTKPIPFEVAMAEIGKGLATLKWCLTKNGVDFGTYLEKIEINLMVSAKSSTEEKVGGHLELDSSVPLGAGVEGSASNKISTSNGNTVKITYKNPFFSKKNELIGAKNPEDVEKLMKILYPHPEDLEGPELSSIKCDLKIRHP